jgi:hypothetical protein
VPEREGHEQGDGERRGLQNADRHRGRLGEADGEDPDGETEADRGGDGETRRGRVERRDQAP